jgi:hypothetical protein
MVRALPDRASAIVSSWNPSSIVMSRPDIGESTPHTSSIGVAGAESCSRPANLMLRIELKICSIGASRSSISNVTLSASLWVTFPAGIGGGRKTGSLGRSYSSMS